MRNLILIFIAASLASCASMNSNQSKQIPLKDFFKNPIMGGLRISPDGKKIAALKPYKKRMNLFVSDTGKKNWSRVTSYTDRSINIVGWKGNDTFLYMRDKGGDENFHVFSANIKTKELRDLTPAKGARSYVQSDLDDISETEIVVASNKRLKQVSDLYKVNVFTGKQEMFLKNPGKQTGWVLDHNGVVRMAISTDGVNNTYYYRSSAKASFKKVKTFDFKQSVSPLFFDFKNKNIYATTNVGYDKSILVEMNPRTLRIIKRIYMNNDYDVSGLTYSKRRKEIIAAQYVDWKFQRKFFSNYYKDILADVSAKIPGKEIYLTSKNNDENLFTVYAGSDKSRGQYYLYSSQDKKLSFIADPSPWINENLMASVKPIKYKTRDGLTVEGYLTLPRNVKDAKELPMVVNPHGGPWARDVWGYNPEIQFLANRGYAVLQVNFRGSTGYGKKFWKSSFKQWGKTMQNDITDGVNWAIKNGHANKDRICIYGASYGGYATLAGLTFTPNLYKCGVDYVGVSNLFTFQEAIPEYWKPYKKMLHEMVGHPKKDAKLLKSASPYFHADKITANLFVAQGANDPRVKKEESDQIVSALKKRGVSVEYMVKDNEGHGFRNEENRFDFYREMEGFLKENIY